MSNSVDLEGVILEPGTLLQIEGSDSLFTFQHYTSMQVGDVVAPAIVVTNESGVLGVFNLLDQTETVKVYGFTSKREQKVLDEMALVQEIKKRISKLQNELSYKHLDPVQYNAIANEIAQLDTELLKFDVK